MCDPVHIEEAELKATERFNRLVRPMLEMLQLTDQSLIDCLKDEFDLCFLDGIFFILNPDSFDKTIKSRAEKLEVISAKYREVK